MTISFFGFVLLMFLTAGLVVFWIPKLWHRTYQPETNEDWFYMRQRELYGEENILLDEAATRLFDENVDLPGKVSPGATFDRFWFLVGTGFLLVAVLLIYHQLGSWEDVEITNALGSLHSSDPADVDRLIERIERRAAKRPENLDYILLLADYHLSRGSAKESLVYFDQLIASGASSANVLAKAAQADFLSSGRNLSRLARSRAEKALSLDSLQVVALATLGMASFEQEEYAAAIKYWKRLRDQEPTNSPSYEMLQKIIDRAQSELGDTVATEQLLLNGVSILITPPGQGVIPVSATVYVLARPPDSDEGLPLAVARVNADSWPILVHLSDQNSMAGQNISEFRTVTIEVQVSLNGQPGRSNAEWLGVVNGVSVGSSETLSVVLSSIKQY